jgi:hypothetical protein
MYVANLRKKENNLNLNLNHNNNHNNNSSSRKLIITKSRLR